MLFLSDERFTSLLAHNSVKIFLKHTKNGEYHSALLKMSQYFFDILTHNANLELVFSLTQAHGESEEHVNF